MQPMEMIWEDVCLQVIEKKRGTNALPGVLP